MQIVGANAPKSDYGSFEWTGDPDNAKRFNSPTAFLDEGQGKADEVRELEAFLLIDDQDPTTEQETNDYGGYASGDGPGTAGSADFGDTPNIWPVKNAVDIDITDLVKWKFGQNPGYSNFTASDRELTILVRTDNPEMGGDNGFVRFISKESDFLGGSLNLAPGRLIITSEGGAVRGDFNGNGSLEITDLNALSSEIASQKNTATYDLNADRAVNDTDLTIWVKTLKHTWFGDANLNGEFNSDDFVSVFTVGKYETGQAATWDQGDWDADLVFGSADFVKAFADGGYEMGVAPATAIVPEPAAWVLVMIGLMVCLYSGRGRPLVSGAKGSTSKPTRKMLHIVRPA